jgi:hypothetical protein
MNIITGIHAYNFHLFISYLGKGIEIIRFDDMRDRFRFVRKEYKKNLDISSSLQEIITYSNQLFGVLDSTVNSYSLPQSKPQSHLPIFPGMKTSQISLDYLFSEMYLLSDDQGISEIDIKNTSNPKINKKIIPKTFEKIGDPSVSNMISENRYIVLSYRGYGASLILNAPSGVLDEQVFRTEDAQDVRYSEKLDLIVVADAFDGLVFFQSKKESANKKIKLPSNDFPQEIRLFLGNILVKGKYGLYLYNLRESALKKIWDGPIGAITTYYNYIFFTSKSQINLLIESENAISQFRFQDEGRLNLKISNYLR